MEQPLKLEHFEIARNPDGGLWELGRGVTGITYKALDTTRQIQVALKVIHPHLLRRKAARERFVREARAVANFCHPNIATLLYTGSSEGQFFCATEYIPGETVERRVQRKGPLDPVAAVRIASQVTDVLVAANRVNLVHGDLKSSNIMLAPELVTKLTDFGLAKCLAPVSKPSAPVTTGGLGGNPDQVNPEQREQKTMDVHWDIYCLGTVLSLMLTGYPFHVASPVDRPQGQPVPDEVLAMLPQRLAALLKKMLAKRPEHRFQTPEELKQELDRFFLQPKDQDWIPTETAARTPQEVGTMGISTESNPFASTNDFTNKREATALVSEDSLRSSVGAPAPEPAHRQPEQPADVLKGPRRSRALLFTLSRLAAVLVLSGVAAFFVQEFLASKPAIQSTAVNSGNPTTANTKNSPGTENATPGKPEAIVSPAPLPEVGRLVVKSDPPGLKVEIINQAQETTSGLTPFTLENEPAGKYAVRIKRDGWPDHQEEVDLEPNGSVTVDRTFPEVGLKSDPPGLSTISVESGVEKSPSTVSPLPRDGLLLPAVKKVVSDKAIEVQRSYGLISVSSDRADAEVIVGGVNRGRPPFEAVFPTGQTQVTVRAAGMPEQTRTVELKSDERMLLEFNFNQPPSTSEPPPSPSPGTQASPSPGAQPEASQSVDRSQGNQHPVHHRRTAEPTKSKRDHNRANSDPSCPVDTVSDPKK
jgi:serine/threonine protein kinase